MDERTDPVAPKRGDVVEDADGSRWVILVPYPLSRAKVGSLAARIAGWGDKR